MISTRFVFVSLLFVLSLCGRGECEPVTSAPADIIASGTPFWVDSQPKPEFALINARIDIGSLHQSGDAIEADVAWTLTLGILRDTRAAHPSVAIPDGSTGVYTMRFLCRENHALSYRVESKILSPGGKILDRKVFNAEEERANAENPERAFLRPTSYGSDPDSLVCWAAARKCEGKEYRWPPPPNEAPLEHSERATKMRAD